MAMSWCGEEHNNLEIGWEETLRRVNYNDIHMSLCVTSKEACFVGLINEDDEFPRNQTEGAVRWV